jgi:hypothetical protein
MSRDVHSCTHLLRPRNSLLFPHLDSYYEGAIGQKRQTTSLCNPLPLPVTLLLAIALVVAISVVVLHCRIIRILVNILLPHLVVEAEIIVGMAFLQREAETR